MPAKRERDERTKRTGSKGESANSSSSPSTSGTSGSNTGSTLTSTTSPKSSTVGTSLSIRDGQLIDYAAKGMSFEDMAAKTGQDPVKIAQRLRHIVNSIDMWSAVEMSKIIMLQMQDVLGTIKSRMESQATSTEWAETTVKTLKAVSDHYMKMRELTLKETELIGDAQMRGLKMLLESAYQPLRAFLGEKYPDMDLQEIDMVFISALRQASDG